MYSLFSTSLLRRYFIRTVDTVWSMKKKIITKNENVLIRE